MDYSKFLEDFDDHVCVAPTREHPAIGRLARQAAPSALRPITCGKLSLPSLPIRHYLESEGVLLGDPWWALPTDRFRTAQETVRGLGGFLTETLVVPPEVSGTGGEKPGWTWMDVPTALSNLKPFRAGLDEGSPCFDGEGVLIQIIFITAVTANLGIGKPTEGMAVSEGRRCKGASRCLSSKAERFVRSIAEHTKRRAMALARGRAQGRDKDPARLRAFIIKAWQRFIGHLAWTGGTRIDWRNP